MPWTLAALSFDVWTMTGDQTGEIWWAELWQRVGSLPLDLMSEIDGGLRLVFDL